MNEYRNMNISIFLNPFNYKRSEQSLKKYLTSECQYVVDVIKYSWGLGLKLTFFRVITFGYMMTRDGFSLFP